MCEPPPILVENSVEIAWDYLHRTCELDDTAAAGKMLIHLVRKVIQKGERRKLMLSKKTIIEYQKLVSEAA